MLGLQSLLRVIERCLIKIRKMLIISFFYHVFLLMNNELWATIYFMLSWYSTCHVTGNSKPLRIEFYWLWFFEWCWYHDSSIHVEIYFIVEEFIPLNFKLICLLFQCNCIWCMGVWCAIMYFKVLECTCPGLSSWNRLSWLVYTTRFSAMVSLATVWPYLSFHIRPRPHVSISVPKEGLEISLPN